MILNTVQKGNIGLLKNNNNSKQLIVIYIIKIINNNYFKIEKKYALNVKKLLKNASNV